jgi:hypothetical protein
VPVTLPGSPPLETDAPPRLLARPALVLGAVGGILLAGTIALWAYYGTAVFFEIVRAGVAACF